MKTATGNQLLRAYSKSAQRIQGDKWLTAASTSAGFIIPEGQKLGDRNGYQVFVRICNYSDKLLKKYPDTGGLLSEYKPRKRKR